MLACWFGGTHVAMAAASPQSSPPAAELFEVHCAGCHPNGSNIIRRGKNLKQRALRWHGVDSVEAIAQLITHGRGLMSAYEDTLSAEEIDQLAAYVWQRAQDNWD